VAGSRMNGEGSLYQRASGRWVGAVTLGFDANGRPVRKTVTAKTKTERRQELKDLQERLDDGYTPPAREETLAPALRFGENLRGVTAPNVSGSQSSALAQSPAAATNHPGTEASDEHTFAGVSSIEKPPSRAIHDTP
jgi:hypothetical protein